MVAVPTSLDGIARVWTVRLVLRPDKRVRRLGEDIRADKNLDGS